MQAITANTADAAVNNYRQTPRWLQVWRNMRRSPSALIGLSILLGHMLVALLAPWLAPYDWTLQNGYIMFQAPSAEYWFGTDNMGRDVFSRTLMGGREAISVTLLGTLLAMGWGGFMGMFLGFVGGRLDEWMMRLVDALLAIPWLLFLLLIISMVGQSGVTLIFTLGFFYGIAVIRVVRGATLDFVAP